MDLDTWACPVCRSRLSESTGDLTCTSEGRVFERIGGVPALLRQEDRGLLRDAEVYAATWKRDRFAPRPGKALHVPFLRGPFWRQKARSFEALLNILGPPEGRKVVDVGAGTGWLSYRLAMAGFRCYATDLSVDPQVGLGVATAYDATPHRFERAVATLVRWPLRDQSIDVAISNASLHYLPDIRPALDEASRVLRSGGTFVVMNDPVHADSWSATRAAADFRARMQGLGGFGALIEGYRHFVASDFESTLRESFQSVVRHDPRYGLWFRASRWAKSAVLKIELASFPIYEARLVRG